MTDWASTSRLASRVTLSEGLVIQGEVHLQPAVATHGGPETPIDLLNRSEPFFVMSLPRGEVVFVSKEQVAILAYGKVVTFDDPERKVAARTIPLEIMMVGGTEHRGIAVSELPPTRARALDFLNAAERFFQLLTDEGTLCINRRFVRAVRPLSK
jgi:hypothetical protein